MIRYAAIAAALILALAGAGAAEEVVPNETPQQAVELGVLGTEAAILSLESSFDYPGDGDWYRFQVMEQTQSVVVELRSALSTQVILLDGDIGYQSAAVGELRAELTPGTYYVHLQPQVLSTASYTLIVSNALERESNDGLVEATHVGTVAEGQPLFIYGALSPAGDLDVFCFEIPSAISNQPIRIETSSVDGDTVIVLYALDAQSGLLVPTLTDDDSGSGRASQLYLLDGAPGTYYIMVEEYGRDYPVEEYSLSITVADPGHSSPSFQEAVDQPLGTVDLDHSMETNGIAAWETTGFFGFVVDPCTCPNSEEQECAVILQTEPGEHSDEEGDTVIYLYDASGEVIAMDDDSGEDRWSQISLALSPGVYAAEVAGYFGTGVLEYVLSIDMACHAPVSEAVEAEPNDSTASANLVSAMPVRYNAQISPETDLDVFEIVLESESTLVLETSGEDEDGDTWLGLYDSVETLIDYDDDSGSGMYSLLTAYRLQPGTYYVTVDDYWGDRIYNYTLLISLQE